MRTPPQSPKVPLLQPFQLGSPNWIKVDMISCTKLILRPNVNRLPLRCEVYGSKPNNFMALISHQTPKSHGSKIGAWPTSFSSCGTDAPPVEPDIRRSTPDSCCVWVKKSGKNERGFIPQGFEPHLMGTVSRFHALTKPAKPASA